MCLTVEGPCQAVHSEAFPRGYLILDTHVEKFIVD